MKKLAAVLALCLLLAGCGASQTVVGVDDSGAETPGQTEDNPANKQGAEPQGKTITVTYKVTTTADASVSWAGSTDALREDVGKGEWTKQVKFETTPVIASLGVVALDTANSQTVTCEILIDGESKAKESATRKLATVTCLANSVG